MKVKFIEFCASKKGQVALKVVGTLMFALTVGVSINPNDVPSWP